MTHEPTSPIRVLVVEDSFPVADSLRAFLEIEGFDVRIVGNLRLAKAAAEEGAFDVAVLDIMLGADNVAPVARIIDTAGTPLIYLSGLGDTDLLPEGLRAHPRLDKPCDPRHLVTLIHQVLAAKHRTP